MNKNEPLIRISKRDTISVGKNILIRVVAIILALIVCAMIIVALTHQNPVEVYGGIIDGAVGTHRRSWVTIREIMVLLVVAVGLTPAFMMRFWNIGAEGQILAGGIASAALMIYVGDKLPNTLLIVVMLVASVIAGIIWGLIPAFFKAHYNTNETLFTLMMNYVAMQLTTFLIVFWEGRKGSNVVGTINADNHAGWFPGVGTYWLNVIIVAVITILMYLYLKYSKQGYEIAVVGESHNTARFAGINVKRVIIRTMMISGAICGLAGTLIVGGASHTISTSTAGGRGFTAIIVAWMAHFNPAIMIIYSGLLVFMQRGSIQIASQFGLNENASEIITGIILFFLIGCEFFANYKVSFRKKGKEA